MENTHSKDQELQGAVDPKVQGENPAHGKKYKVKINDGQYTFDKPVVTGAEILQKAGFSPLECYWLYKKVKGHEFERIELNEQVDLDNSGLEHFQVRPTEVFTYYVDDEPETTNQRELTPNQILEEAGLTPVADYYLVQLNADGSQTSFKDSPATPIKMVCPAVKFVSAFRGETGVS